MKPIPERLARLERAVQASTQPDAAQLTWMRDQLAAEGVNPEAVLTPDGVLIVDGPTDQYIGCLEVLVRIASDEGPEAASWTGALALALPRRVSPISGVATRR